ncbi:hypothetical protein CCACVL1_09668 [Corchorus capsularis]|uniref:Lon protease homolog, mitochondrial n=2 Tax=Magnoliopsida TaxID=3398 RepID=A0A1R3IUL2_COCAP|nr:hypothetical protein CCACVL1_09668 [Corchorus capsularis]
MLKLLSSSSSRVHCLTTATPSLRVKPDSNSVFHALGRLSGLTRRSPTSSLFRARFCSDSSDGSGSGSGSGAEPVVEVEVKGEDSESNAADTKSSSSAIVSTYPRPEDYLTVLAIPLPHRPLFPGFYMPIYVKDPKLLAALQESKKRQAPYAGAFLVKDEPAGTESSTGFESEKSVYDIKGKELYNRLHEVGTLAQISSIQGDQVFLTGHRRLRITEMVSESPLTVKVDHIKEKPFNKDDDVIKATAFEVISTLRDVLKTSSLWRDHVQTYSQHIGDFNFARLADFGAAISGSNKLQCQEVLEELDVHKRLQLTLELVKKEMEISKIQETIAKAIEEKISGEQRRYLLNEQLKAIKKELGLETDDKTALSAKFRERLEPNREKCPPHVLQVIEEELTKLQLLEASSSEFNVTRNYLDWLTVLPWGNYSDENFDVLHAQKILDEDHYGLTDVKERILEFIAVGKLRGTSQGKIICLSGPPGVGKTSIGRSIARALNRKFFRFSVGGLSDVAEIKGHRRTYIGAMPGKMVQCLKNVGTSNPLVLIDEIDKLGRGHAGDPASALLELLDPEQNANFLDHYLDVPIDLSKVLFVCTANVVDNIPNPLLDRMEVIAIAGYITDEKMHIARDYLEKTAREACGVKPEQVELTDAALLALIENYCREAGVRNLQKHIEKIYRKIALRLVREGSSNEAVISGEEVQPVEAIAEIVDEPDQQAAANKIGVEEKSSHEHTSETSVEVDTVQTNDQPKDSEDATVTEKLQETEATKEVEKVLVDDSNLSDFVGKPVFHAERIYDQTPVGVVMGLAWTAMGGSTLYIETTQVEQGEGKGALNVTGQLGDVMKESAQIAHTLARSILQEKEPDNPFFANSKLHLHVPAGATPKDGPSAGCTMITSMLSLAMKKPVRKDLAMTGEVTLTGRILPIGGVKEKTIAARRSEVKTIIFPSANRRDFDELAENVKEGLDVHFVDHYAKFRERVEANREKYPPHVLQVIQGELKKLQRLEANSSEFNVTCNYLDWLTLLPWGNYSEEKFDVIGAQKILDEDHYGLIGVKERILEFIAVAKLRGTSQGKIICLSGPPGVDKISIAHSIARALNRNFFRFSVGGLYDVKEIKGKGRTSTGAMPGKMVQCLKNVGTLNPLLLIDDIDKLGKSQAGNPASTVMDLLDPDRNVNFVDQYLDVPIGLSKVLFVCTANAVHNLPKSLLDRMKVIAISGYITDEKMHVARHYVEKTAQEACGVKPEQVEVTDAALLALIENYCQEAGVQKLRKHIERMYRKIALGLARQGSSNEAAAIEKVLVDTSNLCDYVGKPVFLEESIYDQTPPVGVAMGLSWTAMGGCISCYETTRVEEGKGKGALNVTGKLGDVMKESAQIAYTVARSILQEKEADNPFFANSKLHFHAPDGATAKDGPSAGCAMVTSMLSLALNKPVREHLAMTGEVTVTGRILPIGGVKEKTLAARRSKVKTLILSFGNKRDFEKLAANVKQGL